jgi:glycosyltransferase involved in cell wall biosynthesis
MADSSATLPGFTVVVPSLNHGKFIDATLASLLGQDYPKLEIIVVDGGSRDDTVERLRRYRDRIAWVCEPDNGQAHAIAKGFARATQPWLAWLNSDDVHGEKALWAVAEAIARHPEADVAYGRGHYIDASGARLGDYPTVEIGPATDVAALMFEKGYLAQPSVYFRRAIYERVGGIDQSLRYVMDYELWIRLALAKAKFVMIDRDLSGNRWHADAKTASGLGRLYAEAIAVQRRHFDRVSPYFVQAVSDERCRARLGDRGRGATALLRRWAYFKWNWLRLNANRPGYCLKGLLSETIAKSGPVVGDRMRAREWLAGLAGALLGRGRRP